MLTVLSKVTDVFKDYNVSIKYNKFHDDYHSEYLDFDETLAEACSREIYEETGAKVEPSALYMCSINDDPEDSIIEESIGDEIVLTLENGFSREVTFYERN